MQENNETTNCEIQDLDLKIAPVQTKERIEVLDVIRGFALLGILIVNMAWFSGPENARRILNIDMWTGFGNDVVFAFISTFFEGKFYTIFALLFGIGFAMFYEKAKMRSDKPKLLFYKRIFILLFIGLIHAFLIWHKDVLISYAILGLLLPLFFSRKPKTILIWVGTILLSLTLLVTISTLTELNETTHAVNFDFWKNKFDTALFVYGQGTFSDIMAQRASEVISRRDEILGIFFLIFPLVLLGVYIGKKRFFQNIEANLPFIKKCGFGV